MKKTTVSLTADTKEASVVLRVLLTAVLALGGLLLVTPAQAVGETSASPASVESATVSETEASEIASLSRNFELLATDSTAGWIKTYREDGKSGSFSSVVPTSDGSFVAAGGLNSRSIYGNSNSVIAKFDANGNKVWLNNYEGGERNITSTSDGGFVVVGSSSSSDGDLSSNKGGQDFTIAKFDAAGNKIWLKSYGGRASDVFTSVVSTSDGDFIVVGHSDSLDSEISDNPDPSDDDLLGSTTKGHNDFVIAKFDADGNKIWLKTYEGIESDSFSSFQSVTSAPGGNFVAVGYSNSSNDDLSGNIEIQPDFVIAKFDANGNKVWFKTYGGSKHDYLFSVAPALGGGFVAVGDSLSSDGDLSGNKGSNDFIITKFDENGNKVWLKNYGGSSSDLFRSITPTSDGSFVAVGYSFSSDGDLSGNNNETFDFIIAKFDANGEKVWLRNYGGSGADTFSSVALTSDGGFVAVGNSLSSNGDLPPGNDGYFPDAVIAKFNANGELGSSNQPPTPAPITQLAGSNRFDTATKASQKAYPDPTKVDTVILSFADNFPDALAASYLAGVVDAPILLSSMRTLDSTTISELNRLAPKTIYITGSDKAIGQGVEQTLKNLSFKPVVKRIGGATRIQTAVDIATETKAVSRTPQTAFVVYAGNYPDALSVGSLSASLHIPILLTEKDSLPQEARKFLEDNVIKDIIVIGGTPVISETVITQLKGLTSKPTVTRWSGTDRYLTAKDVITKATAKWNLKPTAIGIASGDNFPDALVGGAAMGNRGGILVISPPKTLSDAARTLISTNKTTIQDIEIFGGTNVIDVRATVQQLLS
jgi:putative cell wall-binding protein